MSLKITTRLTLWYLAVFGSAVVLIAISRHLLFAWGERQQLDEQGQAYAEILRSADDIWNTHPPLLFQKLDSFNCRSELQYRSIRFFVHDDHDVLYDNSQPTARSPLLDSIHAALQNETNTFHTIDIGSDSYRTYTVQTPGPYNGELHLTIIIPEEKLDATLQRLRIFLAIGIVLLLVIAWIGGLFLTRRSLSLVEHLRKTAEEITATNLEGRVPVGSAQDELTALGQTFNEMIERLERSVQAHRQFVTNTSHDLRTPLTTIRTELQLGLEEENLSPEIVEVIGRCVRQLDRLDRLTADLMLLAKVDADGLQLNIHSVSIDELLLDSVADVQAIAEKNGIAITIALPDKLPVISPCDDYLLRRAVVNLLDNAINYSPEGSLIQATLQVDDKGASITITDNGLGMSTEESTRAVERSYRGPASHGTVGSGLGLAITKEIITAHNGNLRINAAPGSGTAVTLFLPLLNRS